MQQRRQEKESERMLKEDLKRHRQKCLTSSTVHFVLSFFRSRITLFVHKQFWFILHIDLPVLYTMRAEPLTEDATDDDE